MGWFKTLKRISRKVVKSKALRGIASFVPGGAAVVGGLSLASALIPSGPGAAAVPGIPKLPGMLSTLGGPITGGIPPGAGTMGQRSIFRDDPNVIEALKPYAISMHNLRTYYRAPKGFIIAHDAQGDPFGIPKAMAKIYLGWKPAKKPPISVRDWQAFQRSKRVLKKLQSIEQASRKFRLPPKRSTKSSPKAIAANYKIIESGPGSVQT